MTGQGLRARNGHGLTRDWLLGGPLAGIRSQASSHGLQVGRALSLASAVAIAPPQCRRATVRLIIVLSRRLHRGSRQSESETQALARPPLWQCQAMLARRALPSCSGAEHWL